jgi:hypothetical protein
VALKPPGMLLSRQYFDLDVALLGAPAGRDPLDLAKSRDRRHVGRTPITPCHHYLAPEPLVRGLIVLCLIGW